MFRSANDAVAGIATASVMETAHPSDIVGQVRTVVGSAHLVRTSGVTAQIYVGISVCQGDVVVTGDDSSVGILFTDGTAFNLTSSTRLVLDEFVCDPDGSLNSGLLSVLQGAFSFISGSKKQSSRLSIRTPFSTVRSAGRGGGIGTLTLAAFTFAIIKELQALPQEAAFLDYDLIPYDDLAGGAFTVTTKDPNPRTFIVDNPGVTLVIRGGSGSTFIVEQSPNSALRMAELQAASRDAFAIFSQGQLDPITGGWRKAALGSGGSGDATGNTLLLYDFNQNNVALFTPKTLKGFEPDEASKPFIQPPGQRISIDNVTVAETPGVTGSTALITASGTLTFNGLAVANSAISFSLVSAAWAGGSLPGGLLSILGSAFATQSAEVESVAFNFSLVDNNIDFLAAGEKLKLTYNVTINNGQATKPVVIEITGANDQPTVAMEIGDSVFKSLTDSNAALTAAGTITVNDIDLSDQLTPVVSDVVLTGIIGNLTKGDVLGLLTVSPGFIAANPGDSNNLHWAFNSSAQTFDQLADGEILALTYIVTAFDNHGGAVSQLVTITITGIQDAPFITAAVSSGDVVEDALPTSVSGVIAFVDVDLTNTHTVSATPAAGGYLGTFTPIISNAATGDGSGQVLWNFTVDNAALQFLAEGQTRTQTYTVTITDSAGAPVIQTVTITITGTNDGPTVTGALDLAGAATEKAEIPGPESGVLTDTGTIDFADVDLTDTHTINAIAAPVISAPGVIVPPAGLGTFTASVTNDTTGDGVGQVTWNFSVNDSALDYLGVGDVVTQTYAVTVNDGTGGTVSRNVVITITGTNDAPTVTGAPDLAGVVTKGGVLTDTGTIDFADVDLTDTHTINAIAAPVISAPGVIVPPAGLGTFTASVTNDTTGDGVGQVTWNFSVNDSALDYLGVGDVVTQTYAVTVNDGTGGTVSRNVVITITGTNDAPTVTGAPDLAGAATEKAEIPGPEGGVLTDTGTIDFADVDLTDTHTINAIAAPVISAPGVIVPPAGLGTFTASVTNDTTGDGVGQVTWNFSVNDSALDYLGVGDVVTQTYAVTVNDGTGGTVSRNVVITITGTNDAPTVTGAPDLAGAATEKAEIPGPESGVLTDTGTIDFADVDLTDTHTINAIAAPVISAPGVIVPPAGLGTFTASVTNDTTGDGVGQVTWNFSVNDSALDYLGVGDVVTQTYAVTVNDGTGGTVSRNVVITITGTNDAPTVTGAPDLAGVVTKGGVLTDTGTIDFADVDLTDTHTINAIAAPVISAPGVIVPPAGLGTFTASVTNDTTGDGVGQVTWNFSVNDSALDYLGVGDVVTQTYAVTVNDGTGGTVSRNVVITITGTNDAPTVTGAPDLAGAATEKAEIPGPEGGVLTDTGTIDFADVDLTDTHTINAIAAPVISAPGVIVPPAGLGTFTASVTNDTTGDGVGQVTWNFSVNDSALDYLGVGDVVTQTYAVTVNDGTGGTVSRNVVITITGTNDAPTVTGAPDLAGVVTKGGVLTDTGTIDFADVDLTDTHTINAIAAPVISAPGVIVPPAGLGTFTASVTNDTTGDGVGQVTWNFSVNDSALDYLGVGDVVTQTYAVTVNDGTGGTVSRNVVITITGTNDQPTLTIADDAGTMTEGNGAATLSDSGALSFADLDNTDVVTVSKSYNNNIAWNGGTLGPAVAAALVAGFSVDQDSWNYSSSQNLDFLAAGETITFSFNVVAADDSGAANGTSVPHAVTITITGTNDQPTLTIADDAGTMTEGNGAATLSDSGALSFADLDNTDVVTVSKSYNGDFHWNGGTLDPAIAAALVAGFSVDQDSWNYSSSQNLDFLSAGDTVTFSFDVVATDDSGTANNTSAPHTVTITITGTVDDFDGPDGVNFALATGANTAANNTGNLKGGDVVGTFTAFGDQDPTPITYTLGTGSSSHFIIHPTSGQLTLVDNIGSDEYFIKVIAADAFGHSSSTDFTIWVGTDSNSMQVPKDFSGKLNAVIAFGVNGSETFIGSQFNDALSGAKGHDRLEGGLGIDTLWGGDGNDIFVFKTIADSGATVATADVILDFNGTDFIDLTGIGAPGNPNFAFSFGGFNANAVANSVTWKEDGGNTIIQLDNTGDTAADAIIVLKGTNHNLAAGDFLL